MKSKTIMKSLLILLLTLGACKASYDPTQQKSACKHKKQQQKQLKYDFETPKY